MRSFSLIIVKTQAYHIASNALQNKSIRARTCDNMCIKVKFNKFQNDRVEYRSCAAMFYLLDYVEIYL